MEFEGDYRSLFQDTILSFAWREWGKTRIRSQNSR